MNCHKKNGQWFEKRGIVVEKRVVIEYIGFLSCIKELVVGELDG